VAIVLFLIAALVVIAGLSLPVAYTAGRRRGRREVNAEQYRDLLDRAERYAYGDKAQERAYAETLLALLGTQGLKPPPPLGRGSASRGR
jgi:hypothetical protein